MKFAKAMKGDGGAESTQDKGFGPGSKKGIPASTMKGKVGMSGKKATFKAGKKTVKK
jgi:hypothetical protein